MATVADLTPGDLVSSGGMDALFITRGVHPIWPHLMLVIWRLGDGWSFRDGGWSFDALSSRQEVGEVVSAPSERQGRLRAALLGEDAR